MTPCGVTRPPRAGSGRLVTLARKKTLSALTPELSNEGEASPIFSRNRDSTRVSRRKKPSPPPWISPNASATRNSSLSLSAKSPIAARGSLFSSFGGIVGAAGRRSDGFSVESEIILRHRDRRKAPLECLAHGAAIERVNPSHCGDGFIDRTYDESRQAVVDDFGDRAFVPGDHRRSAGHRFDHDDAEGFRPVDGEQQRGGASQQLVLLEVADFANVIDVRIELRLDDFAKIARVGSVGLCGDAKPHAGLPRDIDRAVGALFRRNTADKCEDAAMSRREGEEIGRDSVMDGSAPVRKGNRQALMIQIDASGYCGQRRSTSATSSMSSRP